jgi:hypothetical protein
MPSSNLWLISWLWKLGLALTQLNQAEIEWDKNRHLGVQAFFCIDALMHKFTGTARITSYPTCCFVHAAFVVAQSSGLKKSACLLSPVQAITSTCVLMNLSNQVTNLCIVLVLSF